MSGAGLGAAPATREAGAIRTKAGHLEQLVGNARELLHRCENFRNRTMGVYDEESPLKNSPEQIPDQRTDMDELQHQLHEMEGTLDRLATHISEIENL